MLPHKKGKYMRITPARAARVVKRASLSFDAVGDPRAPNRTHPLDGYLRGSVVALACCAVGLRDIESVLGSLGPKTLRRLGLTSGSFSDTALWELLARLKPEQFRPVLVEQIKTDLTAKHIMNDLFPGGVGTLDGKGSGSGMGEAPNAMVRQSSCDANGTQCWDAFALRACLTSSSARPVLDQEFLKSKEQEPTAFPVILKRLIEHFPKLFEWVTYDAGMTSRESARLVCGYGKKYLAALKRNFGKLYPRAETLLAGMLVVASSEERAGGKLVKRELRRVTFPVDYDFPGAAELWGVRQICTDAAGTVETEDRIFIVPEHSLDDDKRLRLVRLHWGIENGANWTADVILKEDTRTPCAAGNGVLVMSWLRLLAFNLLSVFRAHLPLKDCHPEQWLHAARAILNGFVICEFLWATPAELAAARAEFAAALG
jgi:hypothetical protein